MENKLSIAKITITGITRDGGDEISIEKIKEWAKKDGYEDVFIDIFMETRFDSLGKNTKIEKGSKILVNDLKELLKEAESGEFGDFTNSKYETPKIALVKKLESLRENVIDGKYDEN